MLNRGIVATRQDDESNFTNITNTGTTTFGYDAYLRRVRKSYTSNVKKYIYSPTGQLLTEKHSDWWIDFVYLIGKLLALFSKQFVGQNPIRHTRNDRIHPAGF